MRGSCIMQKATHTQANRCARALTAAKREHARGQHAATQVVVAARQVELRVGEAGAWRECGRRGANH